MDSLAVGVDVTQETEKHARINQKVFCRKKRKTDFSEKMPDLVLEGGKEFDAAMMLLSTVAKHNTTA